MDFIAHSTPSLRSQRLQAQRHLHQQLLLFIRQTVLLAMLGFSTWFDSLNSSTLSLPIWK